MDDFDISNDFEGKMDNDEEEGDDEDDNQNFLDEPLPQKHQSPEQPV